jgi:hypothetical protein
MALQVNLSEKAIVVKVSPKTVSATFNELFSQPFTYQQKIYG